MPFYHGAQPDAVCLILLELACMHVCCPGQCDRWLPQNDGHSRHGVIPYASPSAILPPLDGVETDMANMVPHHSRTIDRLLQELLPTVMQRQSPGFLRYIHQVANR